MELDATPGGNDPRPLPAEPLKNDPKELPSQPGILPNRAKIEGDEEFEETKQDETAAKPQPVQVKSTDVREIENIFSRLRSLRQHSVAAFEPIFRENACLKTKTLLSFRASG